MADLAGLAGVSKITISRALAGSPLVNEATRARIRELAAERGYALNLSARNLRLRRSHTIAVVVEMTPSIERPMSDPYPLQLLGGITQELTLAGYSVLLSTRQAGVLAPAARAADGIILLGQGLHEDAVHALENLRLPMVVWGAPIRGDTHVVVGSDNRQGGASAAQRFLALGRKRPVFLGDLDYVEASERLAGFGEALAAAGIVPRTLHCRAFTVAAGAEAVGALLRDGDGFDALFAFNDLLAIGAIRALAQAGHRVPEQVSVIGYDDTPLGASYLPPLTSVHQDLHSAGVLLARKVLALIDGRPAQSETLPTQLSVRAT